MCGPMESFIRSPIRGAASSPESFGDSLFSVQGRGPGDVNPIGIVRETTLRPISESMPGAIFGHLASSALLRCRAKSGGSSRERLRGPDAILYGPQDAQARQRIGREPRIANGAPIVARAAECVGCARIVYRQRLHEMEVRQRRPDQRR